MVPQIVGHTIPIRRDPRLAQWLNRRDPAVSPETLAQIAVVEDEDVFRRRVAAHIAEVRGHEASVIWGITHQVVVEAIVDLLDAKWRGDLDFLDHVKITM